MTGDQRSAYPPEPNRKSWLRRSIDFVVALWTRLDRRLPDKPPGDDFTWTTKL